MSPIQGGTDLNGDGDATDFLVHVIALPTAGVAIQNLIVEVDALVPATLTPGQGGALSQKLEDAIDQLDKGHTNAARHKLQDFIRSMGSLTEGI